MSRTGVKGTLDEVVDRVENEVHKEKQLLKG